MATAHVCCSYSDSEEPHLRTLKKITYLVVGQPIAFVDHNTISVTATSLYFAVLVAIAHLA